MASQANEPGEAKEPTEAKEPGEAKEIADAVERAEAYERDTFFLDSVRQTLNSELDRFDSLEQRAVNVMTFSGLIIAVVVALQGFPIAPNTQLGWRLYIFAASAILLASGFGFALLAFRGRQVSLGPSPEMVIEGFEKSLPELRRKITKEVISNIHEMEKRNKIKQSRVQLAWILALLGVVAILLYFFSTLI